MQNFAVMPYIGMWIETPMNCLNLFVVVTVILLFVIFGFWVFATQEEQLYFFKYIFG